MSHSSQFPNKARLPLRIRSPTKADIIMIRLVSLDDGDNHFQYEKLGRYFCKSGY